MIRRFARLSFIFAFISTGACATALQSATEIVNKSHPAKAKNAIELSFPNSLSKQWQDYFAVRKYIASLNDGHAQVNFNNEAMAELADVKLFPVQVLPTATRLYSNSLGMVIPEGSEILSINQNSSETLIKNLMSLALVDGAPKVTKSGVLAADFSILLLSQFGEVEEFDIKYTTAGSKRVKKAKLKARTLRDIMQNQQPSVSYLLTNEICQGSSCNATLRFEPGAVLYSRITDFADSFDFEQRQLQGFIDDAIASAQRDKAKGIVFDVRSNPGGRRELTMLAAAPFIESGFSQRTMSKMQPIDGIVNQYLIDSKNTVPELKHLERHFSECQNMRCRRGDHLAQYANDGKYIPLPIWLLVDNNTFSAASEFTATLKKYADNVTLVGQIPGGAAHHHFGDFAVSYALPNSDLELNFSLVEIINDNLAGPIKIDIPCDLNGAALADKQDAVLHCALDDIFSN